MSGATSGMSSAMTGATNGAMSGRSSAMSGAVDALCRCTGYTKVFEAVGEAAAVMRAGRSGR